MLGVLTSPTLGNAAPTGGVPGARLWTRPRARPLRTSRGLPRVWRPGEGYWEAAGFEAVPEPAVDPEDDELEEDDDVVEVDGVAGVDDGLAADDPSYAPVLDDDEPSPLAVLLLAAALVEEVFPDRESVR